MRALSAVLMSALVFCLTGVAVAQEKEKEKVDFATKIVGKWEITKTETDAPIGAVVEFSKDGVVKVDATDIKLEGTYKVEKDQLATKIKFDKETIEHTDTIKSLTDDELVLENKEKMTTTLKRKK